MTPKAMQSPLPGFVRRRAKCNQCSKTYWYDYQPFSLSNPVTVLPCHPSSGFRTLPHFRLDRGQLAEVSYRASLIMSRIK